MLLDRAGKWRTIAQQWNGAGGRLSFLVIPGHEAALALATLEQCGWSLDRVAVADLVSSPESTDSDCFYHAFFRKADG
jgi:hypothetical protein